VTEVQVLKKDCRNSGTGSRTITRESRGASEVFGYKILKPQTPLWDGKLRQKWSLQGVSWSQQPLAWTRRLRKRGFISGSLASLLAYL